MNKIFLIIASILLVSCGNQTQKDASEDTDEPLLVSTSDKAEKESPIPVYDFDGLEQALLTKNNDTTYVVNFWATWCKPCVKELPYFEQLGANYSEEKLKVILVSIDFPENLHTRLIPYIEEHKLTSEVVLLDDSDANTWINKVSEEWQGSIPATLIYKNDKRAFFEKSFSYSELEKEVKSIL